MSLMLMAGGRKVNFAELQAITTTPEATATYTPVPFHELLANTQCIADKVLGYEGWEFDQRQIGLAKKDERMFAVLRYKKRNEDHDVFDYKHDDIGFSLGLRSSHDKSMSNGFCAGAQVFICDNLMFTGDITYMRKHTKNVESDLEQNILQILYNSQEKFKKLTVDRLTMMDEDITKQRAYQLLGELMGNKVLLPRQAKKAYDHWDKPPHVEFEPNTVWSFYNACTDALKTTQPTKIIEKHIQLHDFTMVNC
jgi:hypothetical protein